MSLKEQSGDDIRDSLSISPLNITLKSATNDELENLEAGEQDSGAFDPDSFENILQNSSEEALKAWWKYHIEGQIFNHREEPIPLFETETVSINETTDAHFVKDTFGEYSRPVLARSKRFTESMLRLGKIISVQFAICSDLTPKEVSEEVPFDFYPFDVMRIRSYAEENDIFYVYTDSDSKNQRCPIGEGRQIKGMIYFMYTLGSHGNIEPLYIGLSDLHDMEKAGLNWNFKNITRNDVFGRWGYGSSQHLGELSKSIFKDSYEDSKPKYERWADSLFYSREHRLLIDILLRVNAEESHGTAPLGWDIKVCSLPPLSEVGILGRGREGRLLAVPTSRYSYLHPNWVQTRSYFG